MTQKAKTYRVEAVIDLPAVLLLGVEFLGLLKPAQIGGVDVHVALPDYDANGEEAVLHPRAQRNWIAEFEAQETEEDGGWPFGYISGRGASDELSLTRLLVLPRMQVTRQQARRMHLAADNWVQLLMTWIEVVAREDFRQKRIRIEKQGEAAHVWLDRGRVPGEILKGKHTLTLNFGKRLGITPREWGNALSMASEGIRPPEAHLFLRDARHAVNAGSYRRSVLDSATATELGLAKLRDDYLAKTSRRVGNYVAVKAREIGNLSEFFSVVGRRLPGRIQQEISEPRNKAIHEGREPDEETAVKALKKAEEVLDLAFPWKRLL